MNKPIDIQALKLLYQFAESKYDERKSYSCIDTFTLSFPTKSVEPFIKDELKWDGKIFGGNK
jgi:hypothetical protein